MKGGLEKTVRIGGRDVAGMMRHSFCCYNSLPFTAFKAPQPQPQCQTELRSPLHGNLSSPLAKV